LGFVLIFGVGSVGSIAINPKSSSINSTLHGAILVEIMKRQLTSREVVSQI
jgi:hypothetical protein